MAFLICLLTVNPPDDEEHTKDALDADATANVDVDVDVNAAAVEAPGRPGGDENLAGALVKVEEEEDMVKVKVEA